MKIYIFVPAFISWLVAWRETTTAVKPTTLGLIVQPFWADLPPAGGTMAFVRGWLWSGRGADTLPGPSSGGF